MSEQIKKHGEAKPVPEHSSLLEHAPADERHIVNHGFNPDLSSPVRKRPQQTQQTKN